MKVDNFVLLIISIVTLIVISLLTECNRGRLTELENKATKEIVETFFGHFQYTNLDNTSGNFQYKIIGFSPPRYGGQNRDEIYINGEPHRIGDYISNVDIHSIGESNFQLPTGIVCGPGNKELCFDIENIHINFTRKWTTPNASNVSDSYQNDHSKNNLGETVWKVEITDGNNKGLNLQKMNDLGYQFEDNILNHYNGKYLNRTTKDSFKESLINFILTSTKNDIKELLVINEDTFNFLINEDKLFTIDNEEGYEITHSKNAVCATSKCFNNAYPGNPTGGSYISSITCTPVSGSRYQNGNYSQSREYNGTNIVCNNTQNTCPSETQWDCRYCAYQCPGESCKDYYYEKRFDQPQRFQGNSNNRVYCWYCC